MPRYVALVTWFLLHSSASAQQTPDPVGASPSPALAPASEPPAAEPASEPHAAEPASESASYERCLARRRELEVAAHTATEPRRTALLAEIPECGPPPPGYVERNPSPTSPTSPTGLDRADSAASDRNQVRASDEGAGPPPRVRCGFPMFLHLSGLLGDATGEYEDVQQTYLVRLSGGYRHMYCRNERRGLDVQVGAVMEMGDPSAYFGGGLELQVGMPLGARKQDITLGPRASVVLLENNFVGLWLGARLQVGPLSVGLDVLRVPPRNNTDHRNRESTGVYGVIGFRGKTSVAATAVAGGLFVAFVVVAYGAFLLSYP